MEELEHKEVADVAGVTEVTIRTGTENLRRTWAKS